MRWIGLALIAATLAACGTEEDADVARFRAALPSRAALQAPAPAMDSSTRAVGDVALFPASSIELVEGVNGAVDWVVTFLEAITDLEPSFFNSDTREYVWGPFDDDQGPGTVAVYIRENAPDDDFQFSYAFVRGTSNDLASMVPIFVGGATPRDIESDDPTTVEDNDFASGSLFIDFDAERAFAEANNPNFDPGEYDRGKFVSIFGAGPDEENPDVEVTLVIAAFRNFVSKDDSEQSPGDLDYLYGRFDHPAWDADFLNYRLDIDVDEDGTDESSNVQMAFVNQGYGRAEVISDGALFGSATATECWGESFDRTYLLIESEDLETPILEGSAEGCIDPFDQDLGSLEIPSLGDISDEDYTAIADIAENGLQ